MTYDIWTLKDIAQAFGETVATARAKMQARARAGFPEPLPRLFPNERYKWPATECRAWIEARRSGVPLAANDRVTVSPDDEREAARARLLASL